jgi:hypothetical protein
MQKHIKKLFLGSASIEDAGIKHDLYAHLVIIRKVWRGEDYQDFGLERLFRLFLISCKLLFPGIYFDHLFSKISNTSQKIWIEFYVLFKASFPLIVLHAQLSTNSVLFFLNIYLLLETMLDILIQIFVSEQYSTENTRRSLLVLFLNFMEVVFGFAVIYSYGRFLNIPIADQIDALYFSIMTSTTIGFGDIHPAGNPGKIICAIQALTSLAFIVLFFNYFNSKIKT